MVALSAFHCVLHLFDEWCLVVHALSRQGKRGAAVFVAPPALVVDSCAGSL